MKQFAKISTDVKGDICKVGQDVHIGNLTRLQWRLAECASNSSLILVFVISECVIIEFFAYRYF